MDYLEKNISTTNKHEWTRNSFSHRLHGFSQIVILNAKAAKDAKTAGEIF